MTRRRGRIVQMEGGPVVDLNPMPLERPDGRRAQPKISRHKKERIFDRDHWRCVNCGSPDNLTIDHKKPWSKGGSNRDNNLQTMCETCNAIKSDDD